MNLDVSFHEDAQAEFDEAVAFYALERLFLGEGFIQAVEHAVAHAQLHPQSDAVSEWSDSRIR